MNHKDSQSTGSEPDKMGFGRHEVPEKRLGRHAAGEGPLRARKRPADRRSRQAGGCGRNGGQDHSDTLDIDKPKKN